MKYDFAQGIGYIYIPPSEEYKTGTVWWQDLQFLELLRLHYHLLPPLLTAQPTRISSYHHAFHRFLQQHPHRG